MTNWFNQLLDWDVDLAPNFNEWNLAQRTCSLNASSVGGSIVADLSVVMAIVYRNSSNVSTSLRFLPYESNA